MDAQNESENAQKLAVKLTSEQAEILLKADLRNLAKKVQQGKTLSVAERNILQSALAGQSPSAAEFAKNQVELAEILGVDRKTIQRWRKIKVAESSSSAPPSPPPAATSLSRSSTRRTGQQESSGCGPLRSLFSIFGLCANNQ
jgi:hypothetical protein